MAFTDIVTLALVIGVVFVLDIIGLVTRFGIFYLAAGMLSVFTGGWVFNNGAVTYAEAYDPLTTSYHALSVDANIFAVLFAIMSIASFVLLMKLRWQ